MAKTAAATELSPAGVSQPCPHPGAAGGLPLPAQERSDGDHAVNGMMGSTAISMAGMGGMTGGSMQATSGTSGLATAMSQFVGSAMNKSGVQMSDMQALINKLSSSGGAI